MFYRRLSLRGSLMYPVKEIGRTAVGFGLSLLVNVPARQIALVVLTIPRKERSPRTESRRKKLESQRGK
jgi:hypothetical protein